MRRERVLKTALKEDCAPSLAVLAAQLEVVLLARHVGHDVADPAPVVEALMQKAQLGLSRFKREEAERGAP